MQTTKPCLRPLNDLGPNKHVAAAFYACVGFRLALGVPGGMRIAAGDSGYRPFGIQQNRAVCGNGH